jgi:penicillin-binding protein 1B
MRGRTMNVREKWEQTKRWTSLHRQQIRRGIALTLLVSMVSLAVLFFITYTHYAAVLDEELANQSLQMPAGIYAAPRRISDGEKISRDELIERLNRAGYQENEPNNDYATGSYRLQNDGIEIITSNFYKNNDLPEKLHIAFKNNTITAIQRGDDSKRLDAIKLPAEMLTADFNTKMQARSITNFDEIPDNLVKALTAIEDRNFFSHSGIDVKAMFRAFYRNVMGGGIREGGSTITQQLVKNQFLSPERTYQRKLAEVMMALALERRMTKEQILALYCDRVYLGQSGITAIYGFKQAANLYFGKELKDISLNEAALLAGLVKAPNRYSPQQNLEESKARRDMVLNAMVDAGYISKAKAETTRTEHLAIMPPQKLDNAAAPYFVDYVKRELQKQKFDDDDAARLRIETTLDSDLQQAANDTVIKHLDSLAKLYKKKGMQPQAALVALDPHTGEILAMVGGRDYSISQLNRVTDAKRQPGSVFKPIIYAAAMAHGISPLTTFVNAPHEIHFAYNAVYKPRNYGGGYTNQPVMLREAIVRSLNVVAVDAAMQTGLGNVAEMAERMGLEQPNSYPSMALGTAEATPIEIARAYTTFANDGTRVDPVAVRYINSGNQLISTNAARKVSVISPQAAFIVTDTLEDVVNRGTAARIRSLGFHGAAAGKTGTSRDAWFAGYTPNLLVVVWVGFDDNHDLGLTGGEAAVPIWEDFVQRAIALRPDLAADNFAAPGGLTSVDICTDTGMAAVEFCPHHQRILLPSYLFPGYCYQHQVQLNTVETEETNVDEETTEPLVDISVDENSEPLSPPTKLVEDPYADKPPKHSPEPPNPPRNQ